MSNIKSAKNPSGIDITFIEDTHKYTSILNNIEIKYISGTGFLSKFFPVFDPDGIIAERCAKREGITAEEMKERWAAKSRESCRLGTRTHEIIEDALTGNQLRHTSENIIEQNRFDNAIKISKKLKSSVDILGIEKIVFDHNLKIAGTIDLFAKSRKDGTYLIIDHKTNAEIERENKYNKFCLPPISHIPDISFYKYALQLNLYCFLLRYGNYVQKDAKFKLFLNHVLPDKLDFIELPDLQSDIHYLIINYLLPK